jgi:hypothetical protein
MAFLRRAWPADHSNGGGLGRRFCFRRAGRRNRSPYWRTITAAGFNRMPTAPRSSMKVHSGAIRLTTSSGVNIDAIAITSICAIQERTTPCLRSQYSDAGGRIVNVYRQGAAVFAL